MIAQLDFYKKETGKWYAGGLMKIEPAPWEDGIQQAIVDNQLELTDSWVKNEDFFVVLSQAFGESGFYNRLYMPKDFRGMTKRR